MNKIFCKANYIKSKIEFDKENSIYEGAPLFRKKFYVSDFKTAKIYVQGLGLAYFYLNGKRITEDLFLSPVSDYEKILWYNVYDVSSLLKKGENIFAVICGNGFFNEGFETQFNYHNATWRDNPKFILNLVVDGKSTVVSDDSWLCTDNSFILYNQIRSGEVFDANKYNEKWTTLNYNDKSWHRAVIDNNPPKGEFRKSECEPVKECEYFKPVSIERNARGYLIDFGQNISGYVRIKYQEKANTTIVISHAEEKDENNNLKLNNLTFLYPQVDFQIDKIICDGKQGEYSPLFTYHGFRYVELQGVTDLKAENIVAVFVHQDIEKISNFSCGYELINKIYKASVYSFYSNVFYTITDCPTREKIGWTNDLQASCEQMLINYNVEKVLDKFMQDMQVEIGEDGSFPGVVPTCGWGRHNGPIADGLFFTMPYLLYKYKNDKKFLIENIPSFYKYLDYLRENLVVNKCSLGEWSGIAVNKKVPFDFIFRYYLVKLSLITSFAEKLNGNEENSKNLKTIAEKEKGILIEKYVKDGRSVIEEETVLAIIIAEKLLDDLTAIKEQLISIVEKDDGKMRCGMFGIQFIFDALTDCGRPDLVLKMIESEPSYATWFKNGATTLWELFDGVDRYSHNHHMYSCIVGWFYKSILGIRQLKDSFGFEEIELKPIFLKEVKWAKGEQSTIKGKIYAEWQYENDKITYTVTIPSGINAKFNGMILTEGKNTFILKEENIKREKIYGESKTKSYYFFNGNSCFSIDFNDAVC